MKRSVGRWARTDWKREVESEDGWRSVVQTLEIPEEGSAQGANSRDCFYFKVPEGRVSSESADDLLLMPSFSTAALGPL